MFSKLDQQISVPNSIDVLGCLFPGDVGDELPTAASAMMMDSLSMDPWSEYAGASGRPYRWAQIIAGMTSADTKADTVAKLAEHVTTRTASVTARTASYAGVMRRH